MSHWRLALMVAGMCAAGVLTAVSNTLVPARLPTGTESAERLKLGPYRVAIAKPRLRNLDQKTNPNGDYRGATHRVLPLKIWYPVAKRGMSAPGAAPLLVYSHGLSGSRADAAYLGRFLASHGYTLVSVSFPLTRMGAPGGPNVLDVVNQPADIGFIIDTLLEWNDSAGHYLSGLIDASRIGLIGHSLGGMTTTLAAYHPRLRDPRVAAAISLAGPLEMFDRTLFQDSDLPFMMLAGDIDAMVSYDRNGALLTQRVNNSHLVTINKASHTGFTDQARWLRLLANADSLGCLIVGDRVNETLDSTSAQLFPLLGTAEEGILHLSPAPICQLNPLPTALSPLRQQAITKLAVLSFLESTFSRNAENRKSNTRFLSQTFARELKEVSVQSNRTTGRATAASKRGFK